MDLFYFLDCVIHVLTSYCVIIHIFDKLTIIPGLSSSIFLILLKYVSQDIVSPLKGCALQMPCYFSLLIHFPLSILV